MKYTPDVQLEFAAATDPGIVRVHNEDSVATSSAFGLAVLADGMGGYNAGEVAALMATGTLRADIEAALTDNPRFLNEASTEQYTQWLQSRINHANLDIFEAALTYEHYAGMGTTLVMALFKGKRVLIAHIGDSRLYLSRGQELRQLTRDHSLLQAQIDAGLISPEDARDALHKNLVTRAVGVEPTVYAEIQDFPTEPGDIYLLCSDGLTDMAEDQEIAAILQNNSIALDIKANQLIALANQHGGRDNVSVILVKIVKHGRAKSGRLWMPWRHS